jgi:hypothetical protein
MTLGEAIYQHGIESFLRKFLERKKESPRP